MRPDRDGPDAPLRVGVVRAHGRFTTVEPLFERGRGVCVERDSRAREGDVVVLRSPRGRREGRSGRRKVERVLGRETSTRVLLEALLRERGHDRRFDPVVEREAREARDRGEALAGDAAREDLRDLPTFTIDPATAKDFDDAISAQELEGGEAVRVWVHIADVSAFVRPGSRLDREAARRATSVYVPGAVEPMLPEALSNDACSLRPHVDRCAVSVEIDVLLADASVRRARFARSLIRSDERLDYDRVDRILDGRERADEPWAAPLAAAHRVAAALAARRAAGGALAVESAEPDFAFDRDGRVSAVSAVEHTESHRLVEHLMIAANEQVATLLADRRLPALHRVHERPDPARVERLLDQLAVLGVPTPPAPEARAMSPTQAEAIVGEASRMVDAEVRRRGGVGRAGLTSLVLRALKQARYDPEPLGHAGLRLARYCHFTSPIRRYPDLVCHRALLSAIGAGEDAPPRGGIDALAVACSQREREAMVVERDADDVARCALLDRALREGDRREAFAGEVTGVIGAGAFVRFGAAFEGMLPVRRLGRGEWWDLDETGVRLTGSSGGALRVGDPVEVRVDRVDVARGRVDLAPA